MNSTPDPLAQLLTVPRILWLALMSSNVLAFGVVTATVVRPEEPFDITLFIVLALMSVGSGVAHLFIPPRTRARLLADTKLDTTEQADPQGSVIFREAAPMVRVFADPDKARRAALAVYMSPFILGMALAESIGLYGVVLMVLGCPLEQAIAFPLVAMLLMARLLPRRQTVLGPLEAHYGAVLAEHP